MISIHIYDWDSLYERAIDKPFNSIELNAKDNARHWYEQKFDLSDSECVEDSIDNINNGLNSANIIPMFDEFGNFLFNLESGTEWRYK